MTPLELQSPSSPKRGNKFDQLRKTLKDTGGKGSQSPSLSMLVYFMLNELFLAVMSTKKRMEPPDFDNDEYVAQLLAKDARDSSMRYSTLGLDALIPNKRPSSGVPKPNTRFLKNILRETDSHNASLKRKEEEEARERMRALPHGYGRSSGSKPDRSLYDVRAAKRRRVEGTSDLKYERGRDFGRHRRGKYDSRGASCDRERENERDQRRREKRCGNGEIDDEPARNRSSRSKHKKEDDRSYHHGRRRAEYTRSSEKQRCSDDDRERLHHRRRHRHSDSSSSSRTRRRSPECSSRRKGRAEDPKLHNEKRLSRKHYASTTSLDDRAVDREISSCQTSTTLRGTPKPQSQNLVSPPPSDSDSDSDPLESLIGPLPPCETNNTPPLRSRGRGTYSTNKSNIDAHFASGYDPTLDVHLDDDNDDGPHSSNSTRPRPVASLTTKEDDDWNMALEALRDRALWRRKGADRLREAGFDAGFINKWAGNGAFAGLDGGGGHKDTRRDEDKDVGDVRWAKKGEKREWDRGKVLTDDGHVDVRPEW
ncbi:hypothetical protein PAAG_03830 [Paracoccidioides lutzii Pb01]|uniref:Pre-mRNA-splicing factor 38B n=1 Tax=Paracoccidioides lutzii (strain ATCC MYA-826 / Pb01) TaxID=502779 RepID=C1GZ86_PARBA|nr:hypothetical protein PAAG_03830 [Paracoccidioides lutzii Pb01]EEH41909.1 hypothetical protein PAAG_03830 [Paracoccidioides lutzii Pb01]